MKKYNLGFISDKDIFHHVQETVLRYSASINLKDFNKNIVDPIKLTFDAKVYGRTMEEVVASECMRQMDKSNNNHIGYFHQNLFRYAGNGWTVPTEELQEAGSKEMERYSWTPNERLRSSDDIVFVVCTQWHAGNFPNLVKVLKEMKWSVKTLKRT